jgi:hypothetical protein
MKRVTLLANHSGPSRSDRPVRVSAQSGMGPMRRPPIPDGWLWPPRKRLSPNPPQPDLNLAEAEMLQARELETHFGGPIGRGYYGAAYQDGRQ